jgi:hypothetical protein
MRRGKGALTGEAHRNAFRKSKRVRLGDRVSYLSALQLRESTIRELSEFSGAGCFLNGSKIWNAYFLSEILFTQKISLFFMTGCASKICGNDWPLPKSCDLRENIMADAIRRYTAMYISDKLRHSDLGSTRGNLPMRVEVLIKKKDSEPATHKRARIGQSSETSRRASKRHSFRDQN